MAYTEVSILVSDELKDIIIAELDLLGYDGIWDKGNELVSYIDEADFRHKELYDMLGRYKMENHFSYQQLGDKNWNEEWEKHYDPVFIDHRICVRSPFHPANTDYTYNIVIQPQMSFGTGHHETTRLMLKMMLTISFHGKTVLDMGTGTGVLAIAASMFGANEVVGMDNDINCVENAQENLKYNPVQSVSYLSGSADSIPHRTFDIVLSNITKNINLLLLPALARSVSSSGYLILAGFLNFDLEEVNQNVTELGFKIERNVSLGDWECLLYVKN